MQNSKPEAGRLGRRPTEGPEAWQTNEPGPFITVPGVSIWSLGEQRFLLKSPRGEQVVEDFTRAREVAHELAGGDA